MKIVNPSSAFDTLLMGTHSIIFAYSDKKKVSALLDRIDELVLSVNPHFDERRNIVWVIPTPANKVFKYDFLPQEVAEKLDGYMPKELSIPDFEGSEIFYDALAKAGSGMKITEDKYSAQRGGMLFEYISEVEKGIRQNYFELYAAGELKKPRTHYSHGRTPDHFITQYELSEMIDEQLLAPASDGYFLELLAKASGTEEKVAARATTRLQELGLPFSVEDLQKFRAVRNAVMHFRVVTYQETVEFLKFSRDYQHFVTKRILRLLGTANTKSEPAGKES